MSPLRRIELLQTLLLILSAIAATLAAVGATVLLAMVMR